MSFILSIKNPANELVISNEAFGLYCIGKAVLQQLVQPNANSPTGGAPGKQAGYSTYRISWPGQVIFAVDLPLNRRVGILGVTQPSAGVWDIRCYCGDGADSYGFDATQYALDVWAYGVPQTPMTGMVFQVFKPDGTLAWDLTRPNPLWPRGFAIGAARGGGITIPALTRPVIIGCPASSYSGDNAMTTKHYSYESTQSMWRRDTATTVREDTAMLQRYEYSATEPNGSGSGFDTYDTTCFILEGATLP